MKVYTRIVMIMVFCTETFMNTPGPLLIETITTRLITY